MERRVGEGRPELGDDDASRSTFPVLVRTFAHADDGDQTVPHGGSDLQRHGIVGLSEQHPPLGMSDDDEPDAHRGKHGRRDFTCERSARLPVHVLSADGQRSACHGVEHHTQTRTRRRDRRLHAVERHGRKERVDQ